MKRNNLKTRLLSLLLTVIMVLSLIPAGAITANAVAPDTKVVDAPTMDSWVQFFDLENPSTQNAGMVWTDKSVFKEVPNSLKNLHERDSSTTTSITKDGQDQDNFLVATDNDQTVKIAGNVKNSKNNTVTGSKKSTSGTFTQDGLFQAMGEFLNATTVIEDGKIQAGTSRKPILVLMTDGEPTMANPDFDGDFNSQTMKALRRN